MLVKDIMTLHPMRVSEDSTVGLVASLLVKRHISGLPVVDRDNNLIGIVSEKDILRLFYPEIDSDVEYVDIAEVKQRAQSIRQKKIGEIMKREVISVEEDTPVIKAGQIMIQNKIRRLPVVRDGKLVGIITQGDVCRASFLEVLV